MRRFLTQIPSAGIIVPPDPWNFGGRVWVHDVDNDGKPDVLAAGDGDRPQVFLFDLDNDTPSALAAPDADLSELVSSRRWDFEAAYDTRGAGYASFYDSDNDGKHDIVLVTNEDSQTAQAVLMRDASGAWRYQAPSAGQRMLSGALLKNAQLARRFEAMMRAGTGVTRCDRALYQPVRLSLREPARLFLRSDMNRH